MKNFLFELCAESLEAARAAEFGGADRTELCSQLAIGGMTPEFDLIAAAVEALSIPVHVLIRPRGGDFVFSAGEFDQMREQIEQAKRAGVAGIAVGILLPDGRVDVERTRELVSLARPMRVTFHRAFDEAPNLSEALEAVISTGADCLLTSGGAPDVFAGADSLARLFRQAGDRLDVMAGGGLRLTNMVDVVRRTGILCLHGSLTRADASHADNIKNARGEQVAHNHQATIEADVREAVRLLRIESETARPAGREMHMFAHEMLREIFEQPDAIRRTLALYSSHEKLKPNVANMLSGWSIPEGEILIAASGSSRHSGLVAEILLEDLCGLAVDVEYASEYSSRGGAHLRLASVLVLSQSGETSDTLAGLREAHERGQKTLAITNAAGSTMEREADVSMPLAAGGEHAIPATKSFTCQLVVLYLLALYEGARLGRMDAATVAEHLSTLFALPDSIEAQLDGWREQMAALAHKYQSASTFLYLGRGIHYAIAREGALKLKEASYVHAEGYPAGELKHGPNALVSDRVPLVVIATVDRSLDASMSRYEKTLQLLHDLKAQGARVIAIANLGDEEVTSLVSDCVYVQPVPEYLLPIVEVIPLQLFAYFMAIERGVDVDFPRNLSKAVVEQAVASSR